MTQEISVEQIIINRLGAELGMTKAKLTEAQVFNEVLVKRMNKLEEDAKSDASEVEPTEAGE